MWPPFEPAGGYYRARLFAADGFLLPIHNRRLEKVRNLEGRPDDVYVASFTKAGTTWTQEMVYLIATDMNFAASDATTIQRRFPYLDMGVQPPGEPCSLTLLARVPRDQQRFIKVHLPYNLLPYCVNRLRNKVVYVTRNPSDVVVSCYHFYQKIIGTYWGSFEAFFEDFITDRLPYCPFLDHVLSYWYRRHDTNVHFITYEEMQSDFRSVARGVAEFLGKDLSEEALTVLEEHCSFESMKQNPSVNYMSEPVMDQTQVTFMRKGIVGDWKNHLTPNMQRRVERWCERGLAGSGFAFQFVLSAHPPRVMPPPGVPCYVAGGGGGREHRLAAQQGGQRRFLHQPGAVGRGVHAAYGGGTSLELPKWSGIRCGVAGYAAVEDSFKSYSGGYALAPGCSAVGCSGPRWAGAGTGETRYGNQPGRGRGRGQLGAPGDWRLAPPRGYSGGYGGYANDDEFGAEGISAAAGYPSPQSGTLGSVVDEWQGAAAANKFVMRGVGRQGMRRARGGCFDAPSSGYSHAHAFASPQVMASRPWMANGAMKSLISPAASTGGAGYNQPAQYQQYQYHCPTPSHDGSVMAGRRPPGCGLRNPGRQRPAGF